MTDRPRFQITLEALEPREAADNPDAARRLARAVKSIGRRFGFCCLSYREVVPVQVLFVLDDRFERGPEPCPWPFLPPVGSQLELGAKERTEVGGCFCTLTSLVYSEPRRLWLLFVERDGDAPCWLSPAEARAWRAAGFDVPEYRPEQPGAPPYREV